MGIKILLADDSVTAQNMGKKILSEAGHDVITVSNGAAAAKKIAEIKPELVLLDVFMPGYSGLELCEKLRNAVETAKLPVLLTVGRMEPYSPQDGARVKADGVIVKPFEATDLTAAVERFAQKAKAPGGYEHTIKIPAPPGSRDDTGRESQKVVVSTPGGGEPRAYEQTMRLDPTQIAALLNTAGAKTGKQAAPPEQAVEDFVTPRPPATEIPSAQASSPALGSDLLPEPHTKESQPTAIPSYMAQYLDQPADDAESAVTARPAVGPAAEFDIEKTVVIPHEKISAPIQEFPAHEQLSPTIPISDELIPQRYPGDINPPSTSVEGLELTSAPPVPDVPITPESGLETTIQSVDTPTIILKDPALVTDRHHATMDFPTQFGVPEAPAAELPIPAEAPSAPVDEFEARLQAAMASYEQQQSTDLPLPAPTETAAELHSEFASELPAPAEPQPELASEVPSPIEASGAVDELDEPFFATAPIGSTDLALPEPIQSTEVTHDLIPSNVVEFPSATHVPPAPTELPQHEVIAEEAKPEVLIETTSVVASTMQHVDSPVAPEKAEVVPMAMTAAAAASAPIVTPSHPNYEAEAELARALKAAMGAESDTSSIPVAVHDAERAPSGEDANRLAAAVERVMQRELPGLIWKIMAELDINKR